MIGWFAGRLEVVLCVWLVCYLAGDVIDWIECRRWVGRSAE